MSRVLYVEGLGAFTSNGTCVPMVMGSLRTGLSRTTDVALFTPAGERLHGAPAPTGTDIGDMERLLAMGSIALRECAMGLSSLAPVPFVLCLPDHGAWAPSGPNMAAWMCNAAGVTFDPGASRCFFGGHETAVHALRYARDLLATGPWSSCLIGGVDSLLAADRLHELLRAERLEHDENPDGFLPGEAAAFLRVSLARCAKTYAGIEGLTEATSVPAPRRQPGLAVARCLEAAAAEAQRSLADVHLLATDIDGTQDAFTELAFALTRALPKRPDVLETWSAAETLGETGTAASFVALAYLAFRARIGGAAGRPAMMATVVGATSTAALVAEARRG